MRLTANEWWEKARRVLGATVDTNDPGLVVQPVKIVSVPYNRDDGPNLTSSIECDPRTFRVVAALTYVQIIPRGYYDTVLIAVANNDGVSISIPLYVGFGKLQSAEGQYTMSPAYLSWVLANPPIKCTRAEPNANSLEVELPLTNAPLLVWCSDGVDPTSTATFPLTVTLMTRRH